MLPVMRRPRLGVCSWSLQPESPADLAEAIQRLELDACQLALVPLATDSAWKDAVDVLKDAGIDVVSGMLAMKGEDYSTLETIRETGGVALDKTWKENLKIAERVAAIAAEENIRLVTFHAGFLPHEREDPRREVLLDRLRQVAEVFMKRGVDLALETGQETADTLLEALRDLRCSNVGVNFDPANMILYGMGEPVDAYKKVAMKVRQVHIKDAHPTKKPGTWGSEVPTGEGAVNWNGFFRVYHSMPRPVDCIIEREAGSSREKDIAAARELVRNLMKKKEGSGAR